MVFQYAHRNGRTLHVCPRFLTLKKSSWLFSWGEKIFLSKILLGQVLGQFLNCHMLYYNYSWYDIYLKSRGKHLVRFFIIQTIEVPENIACPRQLSLGSFFAKMPWLCLLTTRIVHLWLQLLLYQMYSSYSPINGSRLSPSDIHPWNLRVPFMAL